MFEPLWHHVDQCDRCSRVDLELCPEGRAIQAEVFQRAAELIAPIPTERREGEQS